MSTLAELRLGVYRDLADEAAPHTFSTLQVEDFIRGGIADLNRVAPADVADDLTLVVDPDTGIVTQFAYPTVVMQPYRVELVRLSDGWRYDLSEPIDGYVGSAGYAFRQTPTGGVIDFPAWWITTVDPLLYGIRISGYAARPLPDSVDETTTPSPEVGLGPEEEFSVRAYAKSAGFDLLAHDRSLFAQWQGQTNNTDVSPTQMMQMASNSKQEWDRHRGLIRVVHKYW
jgi:hypothetical protein